MVVSAKAKRILILTLLLFLSTIGASPSYAVTDYIFFSVDGDTTQTSMTQGQTFGWGANCAVGATTNWEIYIDINTNGNIDMGTDVLLASFNVTDGDTSPEGLEADNNPVPDGYCIGPELVFGIAAAQYIFLITDLSDSTSAQKSFISNVLTTPTNKFTGTVTADGVTAPDATLANIWIEVEVASETPQIWSALTDVNGYYEINMTAVASDAWGSVYPGQLDGYVPPSFQEYYISGVTNNIDFHYTLPTDSIYGTIKDDAGTLITTQQRVMAYPESGGSDERWYESYDGNYVLFFGASDTGSWWMNMDSDFLVPNYLVPYSFNFSFDTIATFQHDFICTRTDTLLYIKVTENGLEPVNSYRVSISSNNLQSNTYVVSGTGSSNIVPAYISTLDPNGWAAWVETWDDQYPIPPGFVLEAGDHYDHSPGDTITLNLISGNAVSDYVYQDPEDAPVDWNNVWVNVSGPSYQSVNPDFSGFYNVDVAPGTYNINVDANGYLSNPLWRDVIVSGDTTGGLDFTINEAHCRITGQLIGLPLPLESSSNMVIALTGTIPDAYYTFAMVDSVTGTYSMFVCDDTNWTMVAPNGFVGFDDPLPVNIDVFEAPDTLKIVDFIYTPQSCCQGIRGNANGDIDDAVNLLDLLYMVDYMFAQPQGPPPPCFEEADVNADTILTVSDLLYFVDYMFAQPSGPEPAPCP